MNKENKLVPKLRFPEFVNEEEWEEKTIEQVAKVTTGNKDTQNKVDGGKYPFFVRSQTIERINSFSFDGEAILTSGDGVGVGKNFHYINGKFDFHQRVYCIYDFAENINGQYLFMYFSQHFNERVKRMSAKNSVDSVRMAMITEMPIILPKKSEQQKIASSLSSLDELIAAESQKLEALKDHKKGLMQNLFPQEGETVPKYRFKEFEKDGEWKTKAFSHYIVLYRGSSPRPIQEYLTKSIGGINWIKIGDTKLAEGFKINKVEEKITAEGAEKSRRVTKGELILANSMSFGKTYELGLEGCIYDGWFVLREYEEFFHKPFLLQLLNSEYMQTQYEKLSAGGIVQNISSEIVYSTKLLHTSFSEQQKIAECLSSLDSLIQSQGEKIEALKLHKKGLMQGLFPQVND